MKPGPDGWSNATPEEAMSPYEIVNPQMKQKERGLAMMFALKRAAMNDPGGKLAIQYHVGHNERMEPVIGVIIGTSTDVHGLSLAYAKFLVEAIGMYIRDFPDADDAEFVAEFAKGLAETINEAGSWGEGELTKQ